MSNVCLGSQTQLEIILQTTNYLGYCQQILKDKRMHIEVIENIIWSLSNMIGSSDMVRDTVLQTPLTDLIIELNATFSKVPRLGSVSIWYFSNLLRGKIFPDYLIACRVIEPVCRIFTEYDTDTVDEEGIWALAYFVEPEQNKSERLITVASKSLVLSKVVRLLGSSNMREVSAAVRLCSNLTSGPNEISRLLSDMGLLEVPRSDAAAARTAEMSVQADPARRALAELEHHGHGRKPDLGPGQAFLFRAADKLLVGDRHCD